MKLLVVGASGFVGGFLMEAFGADAVGTYANRPRPGLLPLDLRDHSAVRRLIRELQPRWILLPAAQPHVDWCEDHEAESRAVNVAGVLALAEEARAVAARVLFFSTDYVFDGAAGPYHEEATPSPLNVYGRQKLAAEHGVLEAGRENIVVRVCGVYGCEEPPKNFVMTLLRRLRAGEAVRVPNDQWGTPTYVRDIARAVQRLVESGASGVWHVAGPDFLPRHEFAFRICRHFGLDSSLIAPTPTHALGQRAPRPLRAGLVAERIGQLGVHLRGVEEGLQAVREELVLRSAAG